MLKELKYYEAIDPLVAIASETDPAVYGPALDGLRGIADPDQSDMPRLVGLLYRTKPGLTVTKSRRRSRSSATSCPRARIECKGC